MKDFKELSGTVIFDNAGGISLDLGFIDELEFFHFYDDPKSAASDLLDYLESGDLSGWEGNEPDNRFEPSYDELKNGMYKQYSLEKIVEKAKNFVPDMCGNSEREFLKIIFVSQVLNGQSIISLL